MSGFVEQYGFVTGVTAAPEIAPRKNLTGDPYYTDGLRAVIFLSVQAVPLSKTKEIALGVAACVTPGYALSVGAATAPPKSPTALASSSL